MANKKMLINTTQPEEIRVALVEDQRLVDLDIEASIKTQRKANIYKAKISRVEPSLNAVFVNYGAERHGFLPIKEISPAYFQRPVEYGQRPDIKSLLREGQEIIIQVDKDERGNKGAAVTTYITLAGCYLVLMPNNQGAGGVSRRVEGEEREQLKEVLGGLHLPEGMGVIARTAGMGRTREELQWDLDALLKLWHAIEHAATERTAPFLIYEESDVMMRAIRDYLKPDISEVIVDTEAAYNRVLQHVKRLRPDFINRLRFYQGDASLFTRYQIESQIELAYQREVTLPSGGSIVIDHTEALTSIDINSARATKGGDIEETALQTNLEAAQEIARQLRLRDLGGLIVIDFIDMSAPRSQREVENQLTQALKADRARVQLGRISQFGLLEMSRQRLRPSLGESSGLICPRCSGRGSIRSVESLALSMVRLIKEEALKPNTAEIQLQVPVPVATYLLNEKRVLIQETETQQKVKVLVIPNPHFHTPHYELSRIKSGTEGSESVSSHTMVSTPAAAPVPYARQNALVHEEPAIKEISVEAAPIVKKPKLGFLQNIWKALLGGESSAEQSVKHTTQKKKPMNQSQRDNQRRDRGGDRNRRNQGPQRERDPRSDVRQDKPDNRNERNNKIERPEDDTRRQERQKPAQGRQKPAASQSASAAPTQQTPRKERPETKQRTERTERSERPERADRTERSERPERVERPRNKPQAAPVVTPAPVVAEPMAEEPIVVVTPVIPASKISKQVEAILAKPHALSAERCEFVESAQQAQTPSHLGKQEVIERTEFSLEEARKRLAEVSSAKLVETRETDLAQQTPKLGVKIQEV